MIPPDIATTMNERLWTAERIAKVTHGLYVSADVVPVIPIETMRSFMQMVSEDMQAELNTANQRVQELEASFDLRWDSDMRAIKQWQAATGEELKWPNHADLCVWLMQRIAELEAQAAREPIPQSLEYDLITYAIKHGELPQGYSLFRRKEAGE